MSLLEELILSGVIEEEHRKLFTLEDSDTNIFNFAIDAGIISERQFYEFLSKKHNVKYIDINKLIFNDLFKLNFGNIDKNFLIIEKTRSGVSIGISDPADLLLKDRINRKFFDKEVNFYIVPKNQIDRFFKELNKNDRSIIERTNSILVEAINNKVTDVHFDPTEKLVMVNFRIAGELEKYGIVLRNDWEKMKRRIKVIADLDIAEQRIPQSGYGAVILPHKSVNLRISTHPGIFGEAITIRIQDFESQFLNLDQIGFSSDEKRAILQGISYPSGLFIVAGPTGSGKTTTLYAILNEFKGKNIMTLEDPVELRIPGFKQLDMKEENLISFSDGIKSILRHDPDIILIGEIREPVVAKMALRAALTGKLVFTTVHAFDSIGAVSRLVELGLNFSDIVKNTSVIMSQRLLRTNKFLNNRIPVAEIIMIEELIRRFNCSSLEDLERSFPVQDRLFYKSKKMFESGLIDEKSLISTFGSNLKSFKAYEDI